MRKKLARLFYARSGPVVARELLGKYLVRRTARGVYAARIVETEAYHGQNDQASHASKGKTNRTAIMFGPPGYAYVYLIYGMYHCLNVVTSADGVPSAVLIRGLDDPACSGPGKLCRELKIKKTHNGLDLVTSGELWIEDRGERPKAVHRTSRIGVDYAGAWKDKKWRFVIQ